MVTVRFDHQAYRVGVRNSTIFVDTALLTRVLATNTNNKLRCRRETALNWDHIGRPDSTHIQLNWLWSVNGQLSWV